MRHQINAITNTVRRAAPDLLALLARERTTVAYDSRRDLANLMPSAPIGVAASGARLDYFSRLPKREALAGLGARSSGSGTFHGTGDFGLNFPATLPGAAAR